MAAQNYTKHFVPLESNPHIFTQLLHDLGASPALRFEDVLSLNEPSLLPHPALALILTFSTPAYYEERRAAEAAAHQAEEKERDEHNVLWFKQTIYNACGFYALLHAVINGEARQFIEPNSTLAALLEECPSLSQAERAKRLETSQEIETAYSKAAQQGASEVSENPEDEVDFHFVCFVKDNAGMGILELDGDRVGPVWRGKVESGKDLLGEAGRNVVKDAFEGAGGGVAFSLMVLTVDLQGQTGLGTDET